MKIKDIRSKKPEALEKDVAQLRKELMSLRAQVSMGTTPKSTKQIKSIKKTLARINTVKRESAGLSTNVLEQKTEQKEEDDKQTKE